VDYETLVRLLPFPVAVVDAELRVRTASAAFAERLGLTLDVLVGRPLAEIASSIGGESAAELLSRDGDRRDAERVVEIPNAEGRRARFAVRIVSDGGEGAIVCLTPAPEATSRETAVRLEELSSALRGIKYEINNPLTGALGNINMLLRREDWDEKTRKRLTTAEQEMKKIGLIVARLADLVPPAR
jgi:nitrogen-specific signal transduction histidine kinase